MSARAFDTVVVGAGAAGIAIATRATERSDRQVLLLEAGPDYPDLDQLPADLLDGTQNSVRVHDWAYSHRPTPGQALFVFPRGRVVGGSTAVNTCIALRGHPEDYDEWFALGLEDWSWEACLPAFRRLERDLDFPDAPYHGSDGPIPIRRHSETELVPFQRAFLDAARLHGFPSCDDSNAPGTLGAGPHAMNKIDGVRQSAARGYLTSEVRARDNLTLEPDTVVRRVLFNSRRVTGLEVESRGEVAQVAAKHVVLSGGAIGSLGVLLRSGIGPAREIARLGVELVYDNPAVGAQLLDHPGAAMVLLPRYDHVQPGDPTIQTVLRYTSRSSDFQGDMQLQPGSNFALPDVKLPLVSLMCSVGKPRGVGSIRFPSADPHASPRIDSELLRDPSDHAKAVEAMEIAALFASSSAMRDYVQFMWPRERTLARTSRVREWIYKSCGSGYHPCGTVPMGPDTSATAAVDGHGRVRGVEGLTVADASVFPTIPSSNTNLPTLMLGERFGAWLRDGVLDP
jgi:choline dehydrogenase